MEYNILSPDGFNISIDNFATKAEALKGFTLWRKRYEKQGYYSACSGRISLNQLKHNCEMITLKDNSIVRRYYM